MKPDDNESPSGDSAGLLARAGESLRRADSSEFAVKAVRIAGRVLPSDKPLPAHKDSRASDRVAEVIGDSAEYRPSAMRELGLASVAAWQSLIERRKPDSSEPTPVTILFTDLVDFSSWALRAGDDQVLALMKKVNDACARVIRRHGGQVVKTLGDGTMAVFSSADEAIAAAFEATEAVSAITIENYRPALRAGLHSGAPRVVGDDYLGVDVNIAARVCAAAGASEVYASSAALEQVDPADYSLKRKRRFKAKGVPKDLVVYRVVPRYNAPGGKG